MSGRLWDKGSDLDERILRLTVGRDPELDLELVPYDALASAAHATMLERIGLLDADELAGLLAELERIAAEAGEGTFEIERRQEDCHTAIENRLTERLGDAGRRIHTGRSRNDQVIAALRLWGRDALLDVTGGLLAVVEALTALAEEHRETSVPGYSHTRQAMPSTLGHFFAAYADGLLDDVAWLQTAFDHLDRSPLGSASGFGVALPLDRELVADLLGFSYVQCNTLAVQNDRGKSEALALGVCAAALTDLGRLAADLIWYSADEMRMITLAPEVTTGSSIMPQKRNPDVFEIVRASAARCRADQARVGAVYGGLTSGYHRDLQLTKEPFIEGLRQAADCFAAMWPALTSLTVDRERCRELVQSATAATDAVYSRVAAGEPFRKAYRAVGEDPAEAYAGDPAEAWRERTHFGAPGDLDLSFLSERRRAAQEWLGEHRGRCREPWMRLFGSDS